MGRRRSRKARLAALPPVVARIEGMAHDGRGVARVEGKTVFVDGALPGEEVEFAWVSRRRSFDEARTLRVLEATADRVEPRCPHFGVCGGCALQHLAPEAQVRFKQGVLLDNLQRLGGLTPDTVLPPLTGAPWGYRRKARLAVRYVRRKGRVLVGFRERHSPFVADMHVCPVLHPAVGERLDDLSRLVGGLELRARIAQIEVAVSEGDAALVFRNLDDAPEGDRLALAEFGRQHGLAIYLQPGGPETVAPLWPPAPRLFYRLPRFELELGFLPTDFTQVNFGVNRAMVERAVTLMELDGGERVLDLFCGIGNFSLPLARQAAAVTGVEGDRGLVERARDNAARAGLENVRFEVADLAAPERPPGDGGAFDRVLLDPPRSGALEALPMVAATGARRIVYVACHPGTLARDAGELVRSHGYRLLAAGIMDMFPHTAHVESIAVFERSG